MSGIYCSETEYTCNDGELCPVCGHLGSFHIFRNHKSYCTICNKNENAMLRYDFHLKQQYKTDKVNR
nr:MAG: Zn finger protein [uncultured archaeon]